VRGHLVRRAGGAETARGRHRAGGAPARSPPFGTATVGAVRAAPARGPAWVARSDAGADASGPCRCVGVRQSARTSAEEALLSANGSRIAAEGPGTVVAGFLAAGAIFLALYGIVQRPVRIEPAAAVIALVAAGMAGPRQRRIAASAVVIAACGFILGMVVAVLTSNPLW